VSENPFYKLAPFIQEFIYAHGWTELRAVQVEACRVIFETDSHLLLATGTASGKTEAAFLPVLTLLHNDPPATVGVLYIGPTKALINDQFFRLNDLLKEAHIPVWHWHGDVSQSRKNQLMKDPKGVLQITPESLESLLINKSTQLVRMFGDLRFIIVDEVHVFMGSDRGRQVLCQLQRLGRLFRIQPRRIGLSATLGDYSQAENWLKAGTERPVVTPVVKAKQQTMRLAVEHFFVPNPHIEKSQEVEKTDFDHPYYKYIFETSRARKKCLIFANSRGNTESVIATMRQIAEAKQLPDIYHVHHGSIAAPLREAAEDAMRDPDKPAITAATVTLELGIDIGQLDRVIQLGTPITVSSFLQRLGRSGRRGQPSEMWCVHEEDEPTGKELLPHQIPWQLLHCIAVIQLYLEERWIEPIRPVRFPFSLLYHQTMSTLASLGELSPAALAQRVLTLPPFCEITEDDYRQLIQHLIKIHHIQQTEERGLIVGLAGELIVRNFRFYAVFPDSDEFSVKHESKEIGSITTPPPVGERFALAGRTWEVLDIDPKRRIVFAKQIRGKVPVSWQNGLRGNIHTKILQRMRKALFEDVEYGYLQAGARVRLKDARCLARHAELDKQTAVALGGSTFCLFPWMGSIPFDTVLRCLRLACKDSLRIINLDGFSPYFITVKLDKDGVEEIGRAVVSLRSKQVNPENLVTPTDLPNIISLEKYNEFVPDDLLLKSFADDWLDIDEMTTLLGNWP
jgi:ATP-dependent helicase Lhr and Lhr-like helicase